MDNVEQVVGLVREGRRQPRNASLMTAVSLGVTFQVSSMKAASILRWNAAWAADTATVSWKLSPSRNSAKASPPEPTLQLAGVWHVVALALKEYWPRGY